MINTICQWFSIAPDELPKLFGLVAFLLMLGIPGSLPKQK